MSSILFRIKKRWNMTVSNFRNDMHFSARLAWCRMADDFLWRMKFESGSDFFHNQKDEILLTYLEETTNDVIQKYKDSSNYGVKDSTAPVWVCWWTGLDSAPPLVKQCVKSIRARSGNHPVRVITKENFRDYLEIPPYILNKAESGQMGLAHFADYLRVCLLHRYGGLWLDATIFCADDIPEEYFDSPFFTCKSPYRKSRYLSHFEWATFVLGGWKGNVFYAFLKEAFEEYWKKSVTAIDYLFFDHMIFLARKRIPAIRSMMDSLPTNTPHRDELQAAFNDALPAKEFRNVIQGDTPIYKLSWREKYLQEVDGRQTVYGFFLDMEV